MYFDCRHNCSPYSYDVSYWLCRDNCTANIQPKHIKFCQRVTVKGLKTAEPVFCVVIKNKENGICQKKSVGGRRRLLEEDYLPDGDIDDEEEMAVDQEFVKEVIVNK